MTLNGKQIAALIVGSMLFLPGLCFLAFGMDGGLGDGNMLGLIGLVLLTVVGILAWYVFWRRPPDKPR